MNLYTYEEAAAKLKVAESTLRRWVQRNKVPYQKLADGKLVRFTDDDIARALTQVEPSPPAPRRRRH